MRHTEKKKRQRDQADEGDQDIERDQPQDVGVAVAAPVTPYLPMPGYGPPDPPPNDDMQFGTVERQKLEKAAIRDCMIGEIFSPPRIVPHATDAGMSMGWSIDIDATDPFTGRRWDLPQEKQQDQLIKIIQKHQPYFSTPESALQDVFPFAELEQEERQCRLGEVQTKGPRTFEVCHEGSQVTGKSRKVRYV